jgi:hypothetical protein
VAPALSAEQRANPLLRGLEHLVTRESKQRELLEQLRAAKPPFAGEWLELEEAGRGDERQRSTAIATALGQAREATHGR